MTFRVILGQHARVAAERIRKEGEADVRAALSWIVDQLALQADRLGREYPGYEESARVVTLGDLVAVWTLPGHNIVIVRLLRVLHWPGG